MKKIKLKDVNEYCEGYTVKILITDKHITLCGINEGGYNSTEIDLLQLLSFLEKNNIITLHKDYEQKIRNL